MSKYVLSKDIVVFNLTIVSLSLSLSLSLYIYIYIYITTNKTTTTLLLKVSRFFHDLQVNFLLAKIFLDFLF